VEVFFSGAKARLSVLCAYHFLNNLSRTQILGRLGSGWSKQHNYLFHWNENVAVGFRSRKSVLHRALCRQPQGLAKS